MTLRVAPIATLLFLTIVSLASAQPMGKSKEYRSLNTDLYKISIQKNGQLDVFLANDTPVITDAFPMVWFEGNAEPERLKTAGKWTERLAVEDKLGQGQGILHQHEGWEWSLRAYPTRPYFAVQLGYTNQTKKTVYIKALLPWCAGPPGKGMILLGPGTDEARVLSGTAAGAPVATRGTGQSDDAMAVLNPTTGQSLTTGFLTQDRARGLVEIGAPSAETKKNPAHLGQFRASCSFDPPIALSAGQTLNSEVLYLSISEVEAVLGLQRYARAIQVVNARSGPGQGAPLHAWVISPQEAAQSLAAFDERLRRARERVPLAIISRVLIGRPGEAPQNTAVDPSLTETIRAAGFTPVLWYDPLRGAPAAEGLPRSLLAEGARIHDQGGISEVAGIGVGGETASTRAAILAFREGLGPGARIYAAAPSLLAATLFDGVITKSADQLYFAPQPSRLSVYFPPAEPGGTLRAEITAAALLNRGLLLPLPGLEGGEDLMDLVIRVLPSPAASARAIDLFASRHPGLFHLHTTAPDGDVHVAALANWNGELPLAATLPLARFGLTPGAYYTVYDYWRQRYLGTATDTLDISIPPGDATVLVLRAFLGHPALVSTGANLGQDFPALRRADWEPKARTLSIELAQAATTEAARRFTIAVPAPYQLIGVTSTTPGALTWEAQDTSASVIVPEGAESPQGFIARFDLSR